MNFIMDIQSNFIISFSAGIASSFFIWLIIKKIYPVILPLFKPAPNLAGLWNYYDIINGEYKQAGTAQFKQSGIALTATASRTQGRNGNQNARSFKFIGKYNNSCVVLEFKELNSGGLSKGNIILYLSSNHQILDGYTVYLDRDEGKIVTYPIKFIKVN
jgi:hypothetical protein